MEYKLGDFGLNKQSLKRKIDNVNGDTKKLKELFNKRGTKYNLSDIKYIVMKVYGESKINKDEPLSKYYSKQNIKKYKDLMDMIEIKEKDNIEEKIYQEIKELHNKNLEQNERKNLELRFEEISKKYSLIKESVEKQYILFEEEWLKRIK